jgi:hypothetical protein
LTAEGTQEGTQEGTHLALRAPPALELEVSEGETSSRRATRPRKPAKHTSEEIAAKSQVVEAFVAGVKARKGIEPKLTHAGDHAAAFQLAKTYGAEEACSIVRRALGDDFVVSRNCSLRYVASKADTWRGAPGRPMGARTTLVQAPSDGPGTWQDRDRERRGAEEHEA